MRRALWALVAAAMTAATFWATTIKSAGSPEQPQVAAQRPSEPPEVPTSTTAAPKPAAPTVAANPATTSPPTTTATEPLPPAPAPVASSETSPAPPPAPTPVPTPPTEAPGPVEAIIRAAAAEYGVDGDLMVRIARCESGLNPGAVNATSGALGLFQHLPILWGARAAGLGYPYSAWSDPVANARVSAVLLRDGGPGHWRACL